MSTSTRPHHYSRRHRPIISATALLVSTLVIACGVNVPGMPPAGHTMAATTPATPGVVGTVIKIYFSRFPQSTNNFAAVFPVARVSPATDPEAFAVQLLIAGPTPSERRAGYFSELNSLLAGPSACSTPYPTGGPDFTLHLDRKGSSVVHGTATLRFCRTLSSPGIGADARVRAEVITTLSQFTRIKKVIILTKAGHCFGDGSGMDRCLR